MKKALTALCAVLLASGCGGGEGSSQPESPSKVPSQSPAAAGPGTYETKSNGAVISVEIPVKASDPRVAKVEQVVKADVTYVVASIDNRAGTVPIYTDYVVVIDGGGVAVEVPFVAASEGVLEQLNSSRGIDVLNGYLDEQRVRVGERTDVIFATPERLDSIARVSMPVEELGEEIPLKRSEG